ncbi:hypothetical protein [Aeromicrobium duanguangcaii]|uniref:hypothetical protein n=1 Tax=Aeromicrobium duanguangcaii TaxID=2968086 RepID=UPI002017EED6|nr:hypothetical protein [Aeromicrobium duanguangcaii]MCL3837801.1 hypothetical protein [Aeromicrobium duanguangcaii]
MTDIRFEGDSIHVHGASSLAGPAQRPRSCPWAAPRSVRTALVGKPATDAAKAVAPQNREALMR